MSKIAKTEAPRTPDEEDLQDYPGYISDSFVIDPNDVFSSPEPEAQPDSDPAAQKDDGTAVTTGEDESAASTGKRSSFHWDTDADIIFAFTIFDHCRLTPEIVTALKANLDARGYSFSSDQIKKHYANMKTKGSFTGIKNNAVNDVKGRPSLSTRYKKGATSTPTPAKTTPAKRTSKTAASGQTPSKRQKVTKDTIAKPMDAKAKMEDLKQKIAHQEEVLSEFAAETANDTESTPKNGAKADEIERSIQENLDVFKFNQPVKKARKSRAKKAKTPAQVEDEEKLDADAGLVKAKSKLSTLAEMAEADAAEAAKTQKVRVKAKRTVQAKAKANDVEKTAALEEVAALVDGKATPMLASPFDTNKDEKKASLAAADPKLGAAINEAPTVALTPVSDDQSNELFRADDLVSAVIESAVIGSAAQELPVSQADSLDSLAKELEAAVDVRINTDVLESQTEQVQAVGDTVTVKTEAVESVTHQSEIQTAAPLVEAPQETKVKRELVEFEAKA